MAELKTHAVWDRGTRWFHWINALCVLGLMGVGYVILNANALGVQNPGKVTLKTVHVWIGYAFALNLAWRFVWAFRGNRHARWRAILPGGRGYFQSVREYVAGFRSRTPQRYLGHNPLGRLAVAALLFVLASQAVTGLILAGTDLFYPPIGHWIAQWVAAPGVDPATLAPYAPATYDEAAYKAMRAFRKPIETTHLYGFYVLFFLVIAHVAAVIVTEVREGGGIISAMFTGRKVFDGQPLDGEGGGKAGRE